MKIIDKVFWVYYLADDVDEDTFDPHKVGKWMYFFDDKIPELRLQTICQNAIKRGIVKECKYTGYNLVKLKGTGVCCLYMNCDDIEAHKRCIQYMQEYGLIQKTKSGRYYNISFKLDDQTRAGEYGTNFEGKIKLEQFVDLNTGEWIYK